MIEEIRKTILAGDAIGMRIFLCAVNYLLTRSASRDFLEDEASRKILLEKLRAISGRVTIQVWLVWFYIWATEGIQGLFLFGKFMK